MIQANVLSICATLHFGTLELIRFTVSAYFGLVSSLFPPPMLNIHECYISNGGMVVLLISLSLSLSLRIESIVEHTHTYSPTHH